MNPRGGHQKTKTNKGVGVGVGVGLNLSTKDSSGRNSADTSAVLKAIARNEVEKVANDVCGERVQVDLFL